MDTIQRGIIALLKSAVTGEPVTLPDGFDLEEACVRVRKHHMAALIYAGAVNCGLDQKQPAMVQLFQSYCKALQVNERQMRELDRVFQAFERNGIDYLPMKGCLMKALYPRPELRMMGDADVLIRPEQREKIAAVMQELGFTGGQEIEPHFVWDSPALNLELHTQMIAAKYQKYYGYFGDGWELARPQQGGRYAMREEDTFLFLFAHFTKHYTVAGIGCRHVLDLWVYLRCHTGMDQAYIKKGMEKMGLWAFYQNILRLLAVWFDGEAEDERTQLISQVIFANGSWGTQNNAALNKGAQVMGKSKSALKSRVAHVWHALFPGRKVFLRMYPVLHKLPWLLPAVWVARLYTKVFRDGVTLKKYGTQLRMMNKEALSERRKMLEYVGLKEEDQFPKTGK